MFFKENYKKILFACILASLSVSCGGGGGGGGSPSNIVINNNNGNTSRYPTIEINNNIPSDDIKEIIKKQQEKAGKDLWLAVLDSDFINPPKINGQIIEITDKKQGNGSLHGKTVLKILTEDTNFNIFTGSFGVENENIEYSTKDYIKLFEEFENKIPNSVKIINQSFGSGNGNNESAKQALNNLNNQIEFFEKWINKNNAIFVWANGNTNQDLSKGSVEATFPKNNYALIKGWISAVGIDGKTNLHFKGKNKLASPGDAALWAISASAYSIDKSNEYGSSFAAPRVSRAAGLVASAFPWMKNSQVRDTLFTTTNAPGKIGNNNSDRYIQDSPDKDYGWGILNTARALSGPGAFWKNLLRVDDNLVNGNYYFVANVPDDKYYFRNDIIGDSGLIKDGKGLLGLTGNNTYSGKTIIRKGILSIYGSQNSNVEIKENGNVILYNNSKVNSDVINNGNLYVAEKSTIKGSYKIKDAKTFILLDNNALLTINGDLEINNGDLHLITKKITNDTKEIINFNSKTNSFNKPTIDGMRKVDIITENNKIKVKITRASAKTYAKTNLANPLATANNIENVLKNIDNKIINNTATNNEITVATTLTNMSATEFTENLDKMTAEIYATSQNMSFLQAENINRTLSNHMRYLDIDNMQGWFTTFGSDGKISKSGFAKADTKVIGGQFGIDKRINQNTTVGGAINYSYGELKFNRHAGKTNSDSVGASVYGKYNMKYDTYTLAKIGVNRFSNRTQRELVNGSSNIKHHDNMISTYLEFGKTFRNITPYLGYSKDYLRRGSFDEKDIFGIHANQKNYNKDTIYLGIRSEKKIDKFKVNGYVEHLINISNRSLDFKGNYIGTNSILNFKGIEQNKNTTYIGIGGSYEMVENFDITCNLDVKFKENHHAENIASIGFNFKF